MRTSYDSTTAPLHAPVILRSEEVGELPTRVPRMRLPLRVRPPPEAHMPVNEIPPILIASASAGTGHLQAGRALQAAFAARGVRAEHVDVLALAPRWLRTAYGGGYELLATRAPRVWGGIYRWSDGPAGDAARWGPPASRTLFRAFRRLLLREQWGMCLSTHFLPSQLAAGIPGVPPFALVITDHALHRYWVQPRVRRYFVASSRLADGVRKRLPGAQVMDTGIPVAPGFTRPPFWQDARAALGLSMDDPVALVMGGGFGLAVESSVAAVRAAAVPNLQVIAVCGRNEAAHRRLLEQSDPRTVRVLGYVDGIERLMAAATVVVTKPGGLTSSEALALGRPLILTRPIPGHEAGNVRVLTNLDVALAAPDQSTLTTQVRRFFADPARRHRMILKRALPRAPVRRSPHRRCRPRACRPGGGGIAGGGQRRRVTSVLYIGGVVAIRGVLLTPAHQVVQALGIVRPLLQRMP